MPSTSSCKPVLALAQREVQLWSATVDELRSSLASFERLLAGDERQRADRFRFPRDRHLFIACRGLLRVLLSGYTGCPASELQFAASPLGKPYLISVKGFETVHFNASHSHGRVLLGFCGHQELGVDVEQIRPIQDLDALANRYFAPEECAELAGCDSLGRCEHFFSIWARKEAYLKATGTGLTTPLDSFYVTTTAVAARDPPRYLVVHRTPSEAGNWTVVGLGYEGFAAAVALCGSAWELSQRSLDDVGDLLPHE